MRVGGPLVKVIVVAVRSFTSVGIVCGPWLVIKIDVRVVNIAAVFRRWVVRPLCGEVMPVVRLPALFGTANFVVVVVFIVTVYGVINVS